MSRAISSNQLDPNKQDDIQHFRGNISPVPAKEVKIDNSDDEDAVEHLRLRRAINLAKARRVATRNRRIGKDMVAMLRSKPSLEEIQQKLGNEHSLPKIG